jgi:hypothetical protein
MPYKFREINFPLNAFFLEKTLIEFSGEQFACDMFSLAYNEKNFRFYPKEELLC